MRKRDLELIAALAEGRLEDETEALALIESSPEHRAEYEAQKVAFEALAEVGPAQMTEQEKAALHRDVWSALREGQATSRALPWYLRLSYAAAGLLVVVGLVTVLNRDGVTDLAESSQPAEVAEETEDRGGIGLLGQDRAPAEAPVAEEAEAESGAAASEEAMADDAAVADAAISANASSLFFNEQAAKIRGGQFAGTLVSPESDGDARLEAQSACLQEAGLEDYEVIAEVSFDDTQDSGLVPDIPYLVAVPAATELTELTPVAFVDSGACALVHIEE